MFTSSIVVGHHGQGAPCAGDFGSIMSSALVNTTGHTQIYMGESCPQYAPLATQELVHNIVQYACGPTDKIEWVSAVNTDSLC